MRGCPVVVCIDCLSQLSTPVGFSFSTSVTLWPQLTVTSNEESGRSLVSQSCTFLTTDTTSSGCQMIMEPLASNSHSTESACCSWTSFLSSIN
ncbi:similar to CGI-35 protein (predicted), isoform CRA_c [Rattus norvegicus]|uniref:Similar to CGI-35 protein (Predicted), isoform CRA_c n=1 Tax=Rattus norvegicus TaxID=10116 RepID=A6JDZ5_RAT|nr:similar to CGI-35 protein (predicted), isoform CRA_c [Rattus norvegicus]